MQAKMITHKDVVFNENAVYYFRKTFSAGKVKKAVVNVSADARYKLYINGCLAAVGPCKGSEREKYYDKIDISEYIRDGENEILAQVLQLTSCQYPDGHRFLCSVYRTGAMMFTLWGKYEDNTGVKAIVTDGTWECAKDDAVSFAVPEYAFYAGINEVKGCGPAPVWSRAKESAPALYKEQKEPLFYGEIGNWFMSERPIPMMRLEKKRLTPIGNNIYDAGAFTTGLVSVKLKGTGDARLVYGECFVKIQDGKEVKDIRDDITGEIRGDWDRIYVQGEAEYETFWFKTFRYIHVETSGGITVESIEYTDLCYPLEIPDDYDFGNEADNRLWEMSIRTLHRCMHETYEDCPYYEQLQYVFDTSIQILFTYKITNDDRLARKLIHDFAQSYHFGSTIQSRFPSASIQYIAEFPMFFIIMLHDHYKNFADREFILQYLHIIDGVILWYKNNIGKDGLIARTIYWEYIDWADGWNGNRGCPEGKRALTVQNMLFVKALQCAQYLNSVCQRNDTAREYEALCKKIESRLNELCYDADKALYYDSADRISYSQHPQLWAVLCDMVDREKGKRMLEESFTMKSQAAFGYTYYLFKALEKAGLEERKKDVLDSLRRLTELGCTTIPETPADARSECHGWGAVAIYEFTTHVLGVEVIDAHNKEVVIQPEISGRDYAKGAVATKWGYIRVAWKKSGSTFSITLELPGEIEAKLILPGGKAERVAGSVHRSCKIENVE